VLKDLDAAENDYGEQAETEQHLERPPHPGKYPSSLSREGVGSTLFTVSP
jgi:hypothetical protein